jgi:hypothetical protein
MGFSYSKSIIIVCFFITIVHGNHFVNDDISLNTFWCPNQGCYEIGPIMDSPNATNQCETDSDCDLFSIFTMNCGLPGDRSYLYPGSKYYCKDMGLVSGLKICVMGCMSYLAFECDYPSDLHNGTIDAFNGTMAYCSFYDTTDTNDPPIIPFCPCIMPPCFTFGECIRQSVSLSLF